MLAGIQWRQDAQDSLACETVYNVYMKHEQSDKSTTVRQICGQVATPVSYTHLDVYKRQPEFRVGCFPP